MRRFTAPILCATLAAPCPAVAQTVVLHDNGGIVTAAGAAADGADLSAVQTGLGLTLTGHAAAVQHGQRLAEDFAVPAGGWRIARFELLAFRPGAQRDEIPFDRVHVRVWDGVPAAPGSAIVFGDLADNRFDGAAFADVYRVTGIGTDLQRPVFNVGARTGTLVLTAGTYWVEWQIGGAHPAGPYVPAVSGAGTLVTGNARQFATDWRTIADGGSGQALPLRIVGREGTGGASLQSLFIDGFED